MRDTTQAVAIKALQEKERELFNRVVVQGEWGEAIQAELEAHWIRWLKVTGVSESPIKLRLKLLSIYGRGSDGLG